MTFAISSHNPAFCDSGEGKEAAGKIIYLGACLIAAVRLAREEKWDNTPRVAARISDSINLARRIYERMRSDFQWKE